MRQAHKQLAAMPPPPDSGGGPGAGPPPGSAAAAPQRQRRARQLEQRAKEQEQRQAEGCSRTVSRPAGEEGSPTSAPSAARTTAPLSASPQASIENRARSAGSSTRRPPAPTTTRRSATWSRSTSTTRTWPDGAEGVGPRLRRVSSSVAEVDPDTGYPLTAEVRMRDATNALVGCRTRRCPRDGAARPVPMASATTAASDLKRALARFLPRPAETDRSRGCCRRGTQAGGRSAARCGDSPWTSRPPRASGMQRRGGRPHHLSYEAGPGPEWAGPQQREGPEPQSAAAVPAEADEGRGYSAERVVMDPSESTATVQPEGGEGGAGGEAQGAGRSTSCST
jgi:hypothetical protein